MKITTGSKWIIIGDSVTDAGRTQPIGEGLFDPMGRGYVNIVDALIGATYPEQQIRIVNMGNSGNTVRDLEKRWQRDVIDLKPDWLSIMIGINDVWRQFDSPLRPEQAVSLDEYEATLRRLIESTAPTVKGLILATPFYIENRKEDAMRRRMDEYGAVVRRLSEDYHTVFIDTQAAFDSALTHYYPATLAWDRIHPNQIGHAILAKAFLNAIDFDWNH
ncbi:MAG: SGNH/GDSL hydrolase family protein [bacterium]